MFVTHPTPPPYRFYGFMEKILYVLLCVVTAGLLCLVSAFDLKTKKIPHMLLAALAAPAIAAVWIVPGVAVWERAVGLVAVSLPLLLLSLAVKGAFGAGDIKLFAVCGFLLGWKSLLLAFYIAVMLGGAVSLILLFTRFKGKNKRGASIAFAPYISAGVITMLIWGEHLLEIIYNLRVILFS